MPYVNGHHFDARIGIKLDQRIGLSMASSLFFAWLDCLRRPRLPGGGRRLLRRAVACRVETFRQRLGPARRGEYSSAAFEKREARQQPSCHAHRHALTAMAMKSTPLLAQIFARRAGIYDMLCAMRRACRHELRIGENIEMREIIPK